MISLKTIFILLVIFSNGIVNSQPLSSYPPPSCVQFENYGLCVCPPDSLPVPPLQLISYTIYVNDDYYTNIPVIIPEDMVCCQVDSVVVLLGENTFCATAVYNEWISEPACDTAIVAFGSGLPFYEDWSSGDFETNSWTVNGNHWLISSSIGEPSPSLVFNSEIINTSYDETVESMVFITDTVSFFDNYLTFDYTSEANQPPYLNENLIIENWDWMNNTWMEVGKHELRNDYVFNHDMIWLPRKENVFAIRFRCTGTNLSKVDYWAIDNIKIERACYPPEDLNLQIVDPYRKLTWSPPPSLLPEWNQWDDGVNGGNSIGTGNPVEFDVAARWEPEQLENYINSTIDQVAFFPAEAAANYKIRIWQGADAASLIVDQEVNNPQIGSWNYVTLATPIQIEFPPELWVGYHISTTTGYPAGVDDGPAIDGYGNMINLGGWQTLLEINPELDYNWNIKFHVVPCAGCSHLKYYEIYRDFYNGYEMIDTTWNQDTYTDTTTDLYGLYSYKIKAVYYHETDTCYSLFSNTASDWIPGVESIPGKMQITVFPNPASGYIKISSEVLLERVEIYNGVGEKVFDHIFEEKEIILPVSDFSSGLYFLVIKTVKGTERKKVVIM